MKRCSGRPMNAIAAAALFSLMATGSVPAAAGELPRVEDFDINLPTGQIAAARVDYIRSLSALAYLWGIPAFLNFRQATEFKQARLLMAPGEEPFGGWVLTGALSTPKTRNALPNVDTLFGASYLRLDLQGSVVLEIPPIRDRYYSVAALDSYFNNIEVIGTRTAGQSGVKLLLAPPQWASATPPGVDRVVVMPTPAITLLQRIYVKNESDVPAVSVGPSLTFDPSGAERAAIAKGMKEGLAEMEARAIAVSSSAELFGSRAQLGQDYLSRAVAAMIGIYGNAPEEFLGVGYPADAQGKPFDGRNNYTITFKPGELPDVGAFWSITAYGKDRLLYDNELSRYAISSVMLPGFQRNADGGFTIYVQHRSPGKDMEANWLPVPEGPFILTFRTYMPGKSIRQGGWKAPPVIMNRESAGIPAP